MLFLIEKIRENAQFNSDQYKQILNFLATLLEKRGQVWTKPDTNDHLPMARYKYKILLFLAAQKVTILKKITPIPPRWGPGEGHIHRQTQDLPVLFKLFELV